MLINKASQVKIIANLEATNYVRYNNHIHFNKETPTELKRTPKSKKQIITRVLKFKKTFLSLTPADFWIDLRYLFSLLRYEVTSNALPPALKVLVIVCGQSIHLQA